MNEESMQDPQIQNLKETGWRRPLTQAERARAQEFLAAHPEWREAWEQEAALSYEVGAAYEVKKMNKQALEYFQRAARLIPGFRDVVDRMRHLQKVESAPPTRAVAVGADDEFERAFQDILGKRP